MKENDYYGHYKAFVEDLSRNLHIPEHTRSLLKVIP